MKKLYTFAIALLAAVFCLFLLPTEAQALTYTDEYGTYTYTESYGEITITDCDTSISGDIIIPENIDGRPVTKLGDFAFEECTGLTSVVIPNSVERFGAFVFGWCSNLTSVTIPNSVTNLNNGLFAGCSSLVSVTIPDSVTELSTSVFANCSSLTSVDIPDSVTKFGIEEFINCTSLTSVTIPGSIAGNGSMGERVFKNCTNLKSVIVCDGVTRLGRDTFHNCSNLTSIILPDTLLDFTESAFIGCDNLTDIYYKGTKEQWDSIYWIDTDFTANPTIHYNYVEPVKPEADMNVNRAIIRLQEQMKMGFYYEMATDATVLETGAIVWTAEEYAKETSFDIDHTVGKKYPGKAENTDGTYYSIETDGIPAQAIDTVLYILPYAKTANGHSYGETIKSNSILNVAKNQYNDAETTADVKAVIVDVLNYATAARNYFVAKGEMTAPAEAFNAILTDAEKALKWSDDLLAARSGVAETESEYAPATDKVYINIEDALKIQFVFADSSVTGALYWQGKDYTGSAVHDDTTATGEAYITTQNSYVSCAIRGINAYNIYDDFYVRGYNAQRQLTKTYTHSIAAYLTNQIAACEGKTDSESQALVELCKAMLIYGKSAQENDAVNKGE